MLKGILLILIAAGLMGGVALLQVYRVDPPKMDLGNLPPDPTLVECKQVGRLYAKEVEAVAKAAADAAAGAGPAAKARFVSAESAQGLGGASKASGGFGNGSAQLIRLRSVERYLVRHCHARDGSGG